MYMYLMYMYIFTNTCCFFKGFCRVPQGAMSLCSPCGVVLFNWRTQRPYGGVPLEIETESHHGNKGISVWDIYGT